MTRTKEQKQYLKQHKLYIKDLLKIAKQDRTYDWGGIVNVIICMLNGRLTYYSSDVNIYLAGDLRKEIIDQLTIAIKLFNTATTILDIDMSEASTLTEEDFDALFKREDKTWNEAFNYFGEHIREWWN